MATKTDAPSVFISYSWSPIQNKNRVIEIARKLISDGINVILDEWSLSEGQDKYKFMEKMVNDKDVDKVLIFSNKEYAEKANNKKGGVGTESLILSDKIYTQAEQTKYIPIVMEFDNTGNAYLPTFLQSRKYFDFSDEKTFGTEYQKLVMSLYGKPLIKMPPLGTPPPYVKEKPKENQSILPRLEELKSEIIKTQPNAYTENYYAEFLKKFDEFRITPGGKDQFDDKVIDKIEQWTGLRDNFIEFFSTIVESDDYFNLDKFHSFLEKLLKYGDRPESLQSWHGYEWDNYKFMLMELFLHIVATLIYKEKFKFLHEILFNSYLYENPNTQEIIPITFESFNFRLVSLDDIRNKRLELRRVSVTVDLLTERATINPIDKKYLVETDLILYYLSALYKHKYIWFPRCSIYWRYRSIAIGIFKKLISKKYFEKVKLLFNVQNIEELKTNLDKLALTEHNWRISYPYEVAPIKSAFNYDNIGKYN